MSFDEVLIRDSCAKSRSKIKKYFYYNEYSKDNFPFISNFEELNLLDMIEGTKSIIDVLPSFIPYILIIFLALICIGIWISICCCSLKPKCFLKKDNKNPNRKRFICFMIFSGFALCIIVLGIVLLIYISYAEGNFNGSICSLLMLQYEIINGQGFLAKNKIYKPFWYGSTQIGKAIQDINLLLSDLKDTCNDNNLDLGAALDSSRNFDTSLIALLQDIYDNYKGEYISITSPIGSNTQIIPIYISKLGPKENNETYTGRVLEGFKKYFGYIEEDILVPVTGLCSIMSGEGGGYLSSGLGGFDSVISKLNSLLENLSSTITTYITKFSNYIVNFGYKVNFSLFAVIISAMVIEWILFILYYFYPFSALKCNIYIFIHIINFTLILCTIYTGIFGILTFLIGNIADIIDAILSKENLLSENPRLIDGNSDIQKLSRCLRGDGNLFEEFVDDNVKNIIEPLTQLYILYSSVKTVNQKINDEEMINEYNTFISLEKVIEELNTMKEDFIKTTTKESSDNNDINTMLDELVKYTMAGRRYQTQCASATYDIWTTKSEHCPLIQADNNIITGQCKLLNEFYNPDDFEEGANRASNLYQGACPLIVTNTFDNVKSAVKAYIMTFSEYRNKNEQLIDKLLSDEDGKQGFDNIKTIFSSQYLPNVKRAMTIIDNKITGSVYKLFSQLLNDTNKDTSKLKNSKNFNLFSWMNCSSIGQDYNATLSTLKSNLAKEMRVITICSLVCEFLLIANLYIMVSLAKNLRDKIFEKNDARNVSYSSDNIEEIEMKSIKETKDNKEDDEIYAIKNKKKFEIEENIDKKRGIDVKGNLNKDGNGIIHPAIVSINGPDGRCIFENGENAHKKIESSKNNDKDKETDDGNNIMNANNIKLNKKTRNNIEKKNLPSKKKDIISLDEDKESDSDDQSSSRETKKTKNKLNKTENKMKSNKNIKLNDKNDKESKASSSSVSFG